METIGAFQAKTQFSELLDRVERGEEVTITRHGQVIAKLVPSGSGKLSAAEKARRKDVVARILELGRQNAESNKGKPPVTQAEIRSWREEGRR